MALFEFLIYFFIGILPCIVWLIFYLRQDVHPESNRKIIEIFLLGALVVAPVFFIERLIKEPLSFFNVFLYYIIVVGFTEEFFKYLIVRIRVIKSSHFDEPIDAMLYMVIASLGLATVENVAVIIRQAPYMQDAIILSSIRLLTAIFLHTLAAAITGYFLARSLRVKNLIKRSFVVIGGLFLSSFFHGIYDVAIRKLDQTLNVFYFLLPIVIIFLMGIFVYILFSKVKKMPRSCNL